MKKRTLPMLLVLVLCFTVFQNVNVFAAESNTSREVEGATIIYEDDSKVVYQDDSGVIVEISQNSTPIPPRTRLIVPNLYLYLTNSFSEIAWEPNNILTANVNIGHSEDSPSSMDTYIVHKSKTLATGTRTSATYSVAAGENIRINGIPSGGYRVYAKSNGLPGYFWISVDDWI